MKLNDIGFYTLTEQRAKNISDTSPIMRAEILLTDRCNLKCPYCRGLKEELKGDLSIDFVREILNNLLDKNLQNVRFSGGEPTLYPYIQELVWKCKLGKVKRIAISTNGTADKDYYKNLISLGVNDFSISLDSGCCSIGEQMTGGVKDSWNKATENIKYLSQQTYVTVGVVFNEINVDNAYQTLLYIDSLKPSDIRVIPSAQYNKAISQLSKLTDKFLSKYPILKYRVKNFKEDINFRGFQEGDCSKCHLVLDDLAVAGKYQFPCIIYLREGGKYISEMDRDFRKKRIEWFEKHDSLKDEICRNNCLDVCRQFNNRINYYKGKK